MSEAAGSAPRSAGQRDLAAQVLICVAVAVGIAGVFVQHPVATLIGGLSLFVFLWLSRRLLGPPALVPLCLSFLAFAGALASGVSVDGLLHAVDRALFLTALLSMLTLLRQAAARSRDVLFKRELRRSIFKAVCIPGHQVPYASREMPIARGLKSLLIIVSVAKRRQGI